MTVRIRMKQLGRRNRHYYRIVAVDRREPRDGRVIEELGSYDPYIPNKDERVDFIASRVKYWLSVGAQPTEKVAVFIKKYMSKLEQKESQQAQASQPVTAASAGAAAPAEEGAS